jgi:TonB family protein
VFLGKRAVLLSFVAFVAVPGTGIGRAQEAPTDIARRAKSKVQAAYPDLARKMNITGTVKVRVLVSPAGLVADAKVVGGHPVLGNAALDAVKKWRFEPAAVETSGTIDFKFEGHQ